MGGKDRKPFANPFGELKGLRVSGEGKRPAPLPAVPEPTAESDFLEEMKRLGVQRKGAAKPPASPTPPPVREEPPMDDRSLFLAALGRMETAFEDEIPAEEPASAPRRMKQVRQGKLAPEAILDLHGLDRCQAREKVRHFLDDSAWQGKRTVMIITGRGAGSGGEAVLRQETENYLRREAAASVSEWGRAPARLGGEGALVVFLRERKKK